MLLGQLRRISNGRQLMDLYNAFSLLIMNKIINKEPNWQAWDRESEAAQYDRHVVHRPVARLTYELRRTWIDEKDAVST